MKHRNRILLPRFVLSAALCAAALLFAATAFAQESAPAAGAKNFAGTWHWMFQGKSFATMVLEPKADGFTGSISHADLHADDEGKITDASAGSGTSPIVKSSMENGVLLIFTQDGDDENEWAITLTSPTTAEIRIAGDGAPKIEVIHAEKAP